MVARCCKTIRSCDPMLTMALPFKTWATEKQFGLARTPDLKLILWYHDRIEIDTSFSVMAVTPQTPKCHHNLGCASVVVTFGSLWCHSHDLKLGINSFNNSSVWLYHHIIHKFTKIHIRSSTCVATTPGGYFMTLGELTKWVFVSITMTS